YSSRNPTSARSARWSSVFFFFFSSTRRHTRSDRDWSSDVCSSDLCSSSRRQIPLLQPRELVGGRRDDEQIEPLILVPARAPNVRSEERRVGKECRPRSAGVH